MSYKVHILDNIGTMYNNFFHINGHEVVEEIEDAEVVCFTGGADVNPELYGEVPHKLSSFQNPRRDIAEMLAYNYSLEKQKAMVGICRGAQMLNVLNGGKLFQHVDNHAATHDILDIANNKWIKATSTHHQMMRPGPQAILRAVAVAPTGEALRSLCVRKEAYKISYYIGGRPFSLKEVRKTLRNSREFVDIDPACDPEVLYYYNTNSLCFQPHPEFGSASKELVEFFFRQLDTTVKNNRKKVEGKSCAVS